MTTSSESLSLLARAAELRAAGTPWEAAATNLALEPDELRQLVAAHTRDYDRLARRARSEFQSEAACAAVAALRDLLRSPETGVRLAAAETIVRYWMAASRQGIQKARERLRRSRKRIELDSRELRALDTSESPKVLTAQGVNGAEKVAQSVTPGAVPTPAPKPTEAPVTAAPARPNGKAATVLSGKHHLTLNALAQRRKVDKHANGQTPTKPPTLELEGLLRNWLPD